MPTSVSPRLIVCIGTGLATGFGGAGFGASGFGAGGGARSTTGAGSRVAHPAASATTAARMAAWRIGERGLMVSSGDSGQEGDEVRGVALLVGEAGGRALHHVQPLLARPHGDHEPAAHRELRLQRLGNMARGGRA